MVSEMRLINNNKCLSELISLQNIFHTCVMNDVSTFYLDGGGVVLPMHKSEGGVFQGGCPRGFCPTGRKLPDALDLGTNCTGSTRF